MDATAWIANRNFVGSDFGLEALQRRSQRVSACIPALNEAPTVGAIVSCLAELRDHGALDQVVVVDGGSGDGTQAEAAFAGADVYAQAELLPEFGPVLGKGDAMWRSLSILTGDVICFFDGDLTGFHSGYVTGLLGPLVADPSIRLVKSTFDRTFADSNLGEEGGRVTQATARPLIEMFYPELTVFRQPLSGQIAARAAVLRALPISTGYGVDIGLLIDVCETYGMNAVAQVDIGSLQNRHRGLRDLGVIASDIHHAVFTRLVDEGRVIDPDLSAAAARVVRRPPIESLTPLASPACGDRAEA